MATLRPVPKPKPKDDFWVEEYRKERSKSPLVSSSRETSEPPYVAAPNPSPQVHRQIPAPHVEQPAFAVEQKRVECE